MSDAQVTHFVRSLAKDNALFLIGFVQLVSFRSIAPFWLGLYVLLMIAVVRFRSEMLPRLLRLVIVVIGLIWFFLYFRINVTIEIAACFLWMTLSFKLLELKQARDLLVYIYSLLYLSAISLLFDQSIYQLLLQLVIVCLALGVLLRLNGGSALALGAQWKALLKVLGLAIPLIVVLFLFFPRIAPLWTIPVKAKTATTGITDEMTPGDIAELANSDERAFRVSFSGDMPRQQDLYWRGVVLDYFDGRTWKAAKGFDSIRGLGRYRIGSHRETGKSFYEILLEPHNQLWVFSLDNSQALSTHIVPRDMGLFGLDVEAIQPVRYRLTREFSGEQVQGLPGAVVLSGVGRQRSTAARDMQLPVSGNQRTRQYIENLVIQSDSPLDLVRTLMLSFREQPFFYTLKPPAYGRDFVDAFMFEQRRGFCAHYAGSLAYMLRLAGIPARVIAGYQGGQRIEDGEYILVRQYDAHAWVEANIAGIGWVRLDPTAMVAPSRIEQSLESAVSEEGSFLSENAVARLRHEIGAWAWMSLKLDQLNYYWQQSVVNYGEDSQKQLFESWFGDYSLAKVVSMLLTTMLLVAMLVGFFYWRYSGRANLSRAERQYLRWMKLLAMIGYARQQGETPSAYLLRNEPIMPPWLYLKTQAKTLKLIQTEYAGNR